MLGTVDFSKYWTLDPSVVFLNHGPYGACPTAVLEAQSKLRAEMEREPVQFFHGIFPRLDAARAELATFIGAAPDDLGFVPNATQGVNAVLRSLRFEPGDELLVTDHAYNACRQALEYVASRSSAKVVVAEVPFPVTADPREAILGAATRHTRLALIDHVTSPTGLVFPIADIVRDLASRGIDTLVDGAHAPGMVALDISAIGAAYYAGNCHKWLCAPKGSGFLHVRRDRQAEIHPLAISHGYNATREGRSRFRLEFDWTGTDDLTAYLCVPAALRVVGGMVPGGWPEVRRLNREKALAARKVLCAALDVPPPCPDEMIGSLATLPLPDGPDEALQDCLFSKYQIEVPINAWPRSPRRSVRISAQLYNRPAQYEALAKALRAEL